MLWHAAQDVHSLNANMSLCSKLRSIGAYTCMSASEKKTGVLSNWGSDVINSFSLWVKLLRGLLLWSYINKGEAVSCKFSLLLKLNSAHILCLDSNLGLKKQKTKRSPMLKQLKARGTIFVQWRLGGAQCLHCHKVFTSRINQNMTNSNARGICRGWLLFGYPTWTPFKKD